MYTLVPEAQCHQRAFQSTTQGFIATMWSDGHDWLKYEDFIKDMKFILDTYISDLKDLTKQKDVTKMVSQHNSEIQTVSTYLRPKESTTESSDKDFPMQVQKTG